MKVCHLDPSTLNAFSNPRTFCCHTGPNWLQADPCADIACCGVSHAKMGLHVSLSLTPFSPPPSLPMSLLQLASRRRSRQLRPRWRRGGAAEACRSPRAGAGSISRRPCHISGLVAVAFRMLPLGARPELCVSSSLGRCATIGHGNGEWQELGWRRA